MQASELFTLPDNLPFGRDFPSGASPWEWVSAIAGALEKSNQLTLPADREVPPGVHMEGPVYLDPSVRLPAVCTLIGPAFIGARTEIRPGAFIRGNVIVGEDCVLGNSCEFKNCLLMNRVAVPHFSYVGDSVLGNDAHLGAGVILSNLRLDQGPVSVKLPRHTVDTGMRKLGAMVGEGAEIGCNAVLQPGTILGKRALVMPLVAFGGTLEASHIAKARNAVSTLPRRD